MNLPDSLKKWILFQAKQFSIEDAQLRELNEYEPHKLCCAFLNWQSRLVRPSPRTVHLSKKMRSTISSSVHSSAIYQIIRDIECGADLTKFLSKGVQTLVNPPSVKQQNLNRRRDLDLLLNDWGVHHLHLSTNVSAQPFVDRTNRLLFCCFNGTNAYLLDILPHGQWAAIGLVETLVREFPTSGAFTSINGVIGTSHPTNSAQVKKLRNAGANSIYEIDGNVYFSNSMMSTAGTSLETVRTADRLFDALSAFEKEWLQNSKQVRHLLSQQGYVLPQNTNFTFFADQEGHYGVFEEESGLFLHLGDWLSWSFSSPKAY